MAAVQALEKRRSAAEREFFAKMRVFARYLPQGQFEALVDGLQVRCEPALALTVGWGVCSARQAWRFF